MEVYQMLQQSFQDREIHVENHAQSGCPSSCLRFRKINQNMNEDPYFKAVKYSEQTEVSSGAKSVRLART